MTIERERPAVVDAVTREFIAVDPSHWGRGKTEDEAMRALKKAGGTKRQFILYDVPVGTTVSRYGGFGWWQEQRPPVEVKRVGFKEPRA